mmetsp:Transcript_18313/g.51686  ORF Transcript_18313/g.51686 Transcript_18313/m.51686 type:complete len:249 (-) Transcript_18313:637-1383(-)
MGAETDVVQILVVQKRTSIKQKGRALHVSINALEVQVEKLVPIGENKNSVGVFASCVSVGMDGSPRKHFNNLSMIHLGIVHVHFGLLRHNTLHYRDGRRVTGIARIRLEGETEDRNMLTADGAEHFLHDGPHEALLAVLIHQQHLVPVVRYLLQLEGASQVYEAQQVLSEARSPEPHARTQKLLPNPCVSTHYAGHFLHVRPCLLANGRDRVDTTDSLGEKRVRRQFRQLGRPHVGGYDLALRNPLLI